MKGIAISLVLLLVPVLVSAGHNQGTKIDRGDLDRDIVERFPIPVLFGVEYANVVPDFGDPRGDGTRSHEGQDFLAPLGTPIVSPTEAIVIRTGEGASAGKYVYTANPGGETFRYLHLEDVANLNPGDELNVGDYIGTVGDTGNAPEGVYHLHFEVRDDNNDEQDPYARLDEDGWKLKEKVSFLRDIFRKIRNDDDYAEFLVETFPEEFRLALNQGYDLPYPIEEALERDGVVSETQKLEQLADLIQSFPTVLNLQLKNGDQGPTVALLQLYLVFAGDGPARDALKAAGTTGYFGSVTEAALAEYQRENLLVDNKGIYDSRTREAMIRDSEIILNLN